MLLPDPQPWSDPGKSLQHPAFSLAALSPFVVPRVTWAIRYDHQLAGWLHGGRDCDGLVHGHISPMLDTHQ